MTTDKIFSKETLDYDTNFHFEYSLESQKNELEGKKYTGYGVSAKMVDKRGQEIIVSIQDITPDLEIAQKLIQLLDSFKISPMCLKMFVEDFLINHIHKCVHNSFY